LKIISTFKNNIKVLKVERKELPFFFNIYIVFFPIFFVIIFVTYHIERPLPLAENPAGQS